ncbi:hypothetical protein N7470_003505 [Penicillium chermesinum]|nr:hypothetical protein N7470_003505 [Penicillium chermesinum]
MPDQPSLQRTDSKRGGASYARKKDKSLAVSIPRPHGPDTELGDIQLSASNAFARMKSRDMEGSKLPRFSGGQSQYVYGTVCPFR